MDLVLFIVICFDIYGVCFGLCCLFLDACFVLFGVWFIVCSYDLLLVAFNCCCRLCACWVFGVLALCLVCCIACCLCCFEVGLWVGDWSGYFVG